MVKYKFTHVAIQIGADARTPKTYHRTIQLRTTKNYFVGKDLMKYYRYHGFRGLGVGSWSRYSVIHIERMRPWHLFRHMWE